MSVREEKGKRARQRWRGRESGEQMRARQNKRENSKYDIHVSSQTRVAIQKPASGESQSTLAGWREKGEKKKIIENY